MMSHASVLYRFRIDLSDIDRGVYELLDVRVAMHASETSDYLLTRVIAYALNIQDGLQFSPQGLGEPNDPAIQVRAADQSINLWIEIGNPSARRLHKASKGAKSVRVYTYKDPNALLRELAFEKMHRAEHIEIFALSPAFLAELGGQLVRDNKWVLVMNEGQILISIGDRSFDGVLTAHRLPAK